MKVIQFPETNPRCVNCKNWEGFGHNTGNGVCKLTEEVSNSDWHCKDYEQRKRA